MIHKLAGEDTPPVVMMASVFYIGTLFTNHIRVLPIGKNNAFH